MNRLRPDNVWVRCLIAFVVYIPAAKLGLSLAFFHPSATPVWLATGIVLTLFILWGPDHWPGVFAGAFLVNLMTAGNIFTSLGIATGNTLEGLVGAYLVRRYAGGWRALERPQTIVWFALLAGVLSTTLSATFGVTSLSLGGFASWDNYGKIWLTWWLGDMSSALVVAPFLLLWSLPYFRWWNWTRLPELLLMGAVICIGGVSIFGEGIPLALRNYPLDFLCIPVLVWSALRFGRRGAASVSLVIAFFAIWGTWHGFGPFVRQSPNASLVVLQVFMMVVSLTGLILAALVAQQKRTELADRRRADEALRASETRYRQLLESNIIGVMIVDWQGRVLDANQTFLNMTGYTQKDLEAGRVGGDTLTPEEYRAADEWARNKLRETGTCPPLEKEYVRKDGTRLPVLVGVVFHAQPQHQLVCLVIDITARRQALTAVQKAYDEMETRVVQRTSELAGANRELIREIQRRKRAESALHNLAMTDPLTGLCNRRGFITLAGQLIKQARRAHQDFLVVLVDLDGLKHINDTYGHAAGDQAVTAAANVLKNTFRSSDVIARIGGDEFAAAVREDGKDSGLQAVLRRLRLKLEEFNAQGNRPYMIGMSVGTAELKPEQTLALDALLAQADAKLYEQKRTKKLQVI